MPLPVDEAWTIINDVPRVAHCAPGAELLERRPDGSYVGKVSVSLGPVKLGFRGVLTYKEIDEANHRVLADAVGEEERARGTARAVVAFVLTPEGDDTLVDVDTDVQLAGAIAQYGRGAALIQSTAQVLMDQFARNFAREFGKQTTGEVSAKKAQPSPAKENSVSLISLLVQGLLNFFRSSVNRSSERKP